VLFRLRIGLFRMFSSVDVNFWRHRRTELDSSRLIPEDTGPIRLGTIIDDYGEIFAALKGRSHALLTILRIGLYKTFSSGSKSGFDAISYCW
jgi:hypothetical protein